MEVQGCVVERFAGDQLPESFEWYFDHDQHQIYSKSKSRDSAPSQLVKVPTDHSDTDGMYTHTLLFATHVHFPSVSGSYNEPRQILTNLLLGKKLRGFGKGSINGIGGKILSDETARESIIRETWEEVGFRLQAQQVTFVGRVRISVDQGEKVHIAVYTARLTNQQRKLVSNSDEIQVIWHSLLLEDRTLQPDLFDAVNLEGSMRPEHKVYLSLLLRHQSERDTGGLVKGMLLDVDIKFHSELKKETLGGEERPENHRELRRWEM